MILNSWIPYERRLVPALPARQVPGRIHQEQAFLKSAELQTRESRNVPR